MLRDGIMKINGKDYVFGKGKGESFDSDKDKEKSTTPSPAALDEEMNID